jgi:hypothetical protein
MTYRPDSASCRHKVSGQRAIEEVAPMINSNAGLAGLPKALGAQIHTVGLDHSLAGSLIDCGPLCVIHRDLPVQQGERP